MPNSARTPQIGGMFHLRCGEHIVDAELLAIDAAAGTKTYRIAGGADPITLPDFGVKNIDWHGEEPA